MIFTHSATILLHIAFYSQNILILKVTEAKWCMHVQGEDTKTAMLVQFNVLKDYELIKKKNTSW